MALGAAAAMLGLMAQVANADTRVYTRTNDPNHQNPHQDPYNADNNPNGWRDVTGGNTDVQTIPAGGCIWFGIMNDYVDENTKSITLKLNWQQGGANKYKFGVSTAGYRQNSNTPVAGNITSGGSRTTIYASFTEFCPAWEFIKLTNNSTTTPYTIRIAPKVTKHLCYSPKRSASVPEEGDDTFELGDSMMGVPGETDPYRVTEFTVFPLHAEVDLAVPPSFVADFATGNWTPEFVFVDPNGDPQPRGGVRWVSDGIGIQLLDMFNFAFTMLDVADTRYLMYTFDPDLGTFSDYLLEFPTVPWYEDFELYDPDEPLHGSAGWKGWDDDPAFDAPVTDVQAHDGSKSLKIDGAADLVREFDGADVGGSWSFEAWQYIPSDFTSGDNGRFTGSYFNILNTYNDAGPYHWSVQIQADPRDGMLKVFHGDDINTIDVPYITDQWVKIQVQIDLEDDWTQVYYDDELVTEYSWTGGVLGEGGGALDIAVLDLYAFESTSVYYDGLILEPFVIERCPADLDGDGDADADDFFDYLDGFANGNLDVCDIDGDGDCDADDFFGYLDLFSLGC